MNQDEAILEAGKAVLNLAANRLIYVSNLLDESFTKSVKMLSKCRGNIVISGMGKSGIIAKKLAATLCSTGTFAHYVHPSEAFHGDFGKINHDDTLILFSHSGETEELIKFVKKAKELYPLIETILITSNNKSSLAKNANWVINTHIEFEHHDSNFSSIPTTSTTVSLAIGDSLAVALQKQKNFKAEQFYKLHPGGSIGKTQSTKII